ncbi:MAG: EamA family transporter [Vicinamibacteria bacterium]|nr:EamA family transporter [Vicinamibacteria bacterium]
MRDSENVPLTPVAGSIEVALAASLWGCWSLFLRPSGLPALATAPAVFLIIGVLLLPYAFREAPRPVWKRSTVTMLIVYSAVDAANVLMFFTAMELTTVAVAVLTHYMMPLIVALLAPMIERERVRGAMVAALIATLGLIPILGPGMISSKKELAGALLGMLSAVAYSTSVFVGRRLMPRIGVLRALSYHAVLGGMLLLPACPFGAFNARPMKALLWVFLGMVLLGVTGGVLYMRGLSRVGATRAAILTYFEPLVAMTVGWWVWHERLTPMALAGAALIIAAGVWISRAPSRRLAE